MKFLKKIKNFLFWGWKLRNDYHWDYSSFYYITELKLIEMRKACYQKGNHVWSEKSREYKAISESIQLCRDLRKDSTPYFNMFTKEFGPGEGYLMDDLGNGFSMMVDLNNPFYIKQRRLAHSRGSALKKLRRERLFQLLNKWMPFWWD